ncbi:MAG: hypothetical protein JXA82_07480 [Sedimentisphaerales bacterium]|nr:hypothetical protein [Sedimentisphaerales bacterium]
MSGLSNEQKDLILDFYFRCGDQQSIDRGRDLIASNSEAAQLYADLEETLTDLDSIKYEPCPDNLVEVTVQRLKVAASAGQSRLEKLLEQEQQRTDTLPPLAIQFRDRWRNFLQVAAIAAVFLLISGISLPVFNNIRNNAWQMACTTRMGNLGAAFDSYAQDYDSRMPYVPVAAGSPWWKVGYQGERNESNTKHYYLMLKLGYINPDDFLCPGQKDTLRLMPGTIQDNRDFPSRQYISYSFLLRCETNAGQQIRGRILLASDRNPVFTSIPSDVSCFQKDNFSRIVINEILQKMLSPNHRNQGQNVLWSDGSVKFLRDRIVDGDDMFMINGISVYEGTEIPCSQNDIFVVP